MATINATHVWVARGVLRSTWASMLNGDVGSALDGPMLPDKTVTVRGTFGVGGTCVLKGKDAAGAATDYSPLNDTRGEGNSLSFTAGDTRAVLENPDHIRPEITAGDGATSLTVIIVSQSQKR